MTDEQKPKQPVEPTEAFRRHVKKMQPRQLAGHLRRQARNQQHFAGAWAVLLSAVYENTSPQLVDDDNHLMPLEKLKDFGRVSPGLR